jgi:hypothetical protein
VLPKELPSHPAIQTDGGFLGGSYRFKNYRQKHQG